MKCGDKKLAEILFRCASSLQSRDHTDLARSCLVHMCKAGCIPAFEMICSSNHHEDTTMMRVELLGEILKFDRRDICLNALWKCLKNRGKHTLCCVNILSGLLSDASSNSAVDWALRKALIQHTGNDLREMVTSPESRELRQSTCNVFERLIHTEDVRIFRSVCALLRFDAKSEDSCRRCLELANVLASKSSEKRLVSETLLKQVLESMTKCVEASEHSFSPSRSKLLYALCQSLKAMVPSLEDVWSRTYVCETYVVFERAAREFSLHLSHATSITVSLTNVSFFLKRYEIQTRASSRTQVRHFHETPSREEMSGDHFGPGLDG